MDHSLKPERLTTHCSSKALAYLSIARPSDWFKNAFILPSTLIAYATEGTINPIILITTLIATCLLASANYTLNEWLDRSTDQFHPKKSLRAAPQQQLNPSLVLLQYATLILISLGIGFVISLKIATLLGIFATLALLYNIPPIRLKDFPVIDILAESLNTPLRLLIGWFIIPIATYPPSSLLLGYWLGGAFLMTAKRLAEYRFLGPKTAAQYRKSFAYYTESRLLVLCLTFAMAASVFLGIFLIKYKVEFILLTPLIIILFAWYLAIALRQDSPLNHSEFLITEKSFTLYTIAVASLFSWLLFGNIPLLTWLLEKSPIF